jgi:hypothetical protein
MILSSNKMAHLATLNRSLERPDLVLLALHREQHAYGEACPSEECILGWVAVSPWALRDLCEMQIQGAEAPALREHEALFPPTAGNA